MRLRAPAHDDAGALLAFFERLSEHTDRTLKSW
jgi:hypothetical protein